MQTEDTLAIGYIYNDVLLDFEYAGYTGDDCKEAAIDMAAIIMGCMLLRSKGCELPDGFHIQHSERLHEYILEWADNLHIIVDERLAELAKGSWKDNSAMESR